MGEPRIYEAIADAFIAEGVRSYFVLTGDGNMHWEATMAAHPGVRGIHVRHEHAACAMATAFAAATGEVGIASVTCGPGLTQIMTALATAAQARIPIVVLAGEDPIDAAWYNQRIDQAPLVLGTGAAYVAARSGKIIRHHVREAFLIARSERRPVVLGVPLDLQKKPAPSGDYVPSRKVMPDPGPSLPHPARLAAALDRIRAARRIVVLGGRGARSAAVRAACNRLAGLCGGALAATLPARGLFTGHPRYIGVAGGFAHEATREAFAEADLVIAVGASLTQHTSDNNTLFRPEQVIQIDRDPPVMRHGQVPATMHLAMDAAEGLDMLNEALAANPGPNRGNGWDAAHYAERVLTEPADTTAYTIPDGTLDPRAVIAALSRHTDPAWAHVAAAGHCSYFSTHMHGRDSDDFLTIREFGAIGNGLSYAIGRWAARPGQPVLLTEGDGGLMMHVQELETIRRYGMKILICVLNDGAFGAEIHKLRADHLDDHGAIYGYGDFAALARGFGLEGHRVTDLDAIPDLARAFAEGESATLWDFHVADTVMAPTMRRATRRD